MSLRSLSLVPLLFFAVWLVNPVVADTSIVGPDHSDIHPAALVSFRIGLTYHNNNELSAAVKHYRAALNLDPTLVSAAINLAIVYENMHENDLAEKIYDEAVRVAPQSFSAHYNRGQFLQKKGDLDAARADYLVAIELSPQETSLFINLAGIEILLFEKERDVSLLKAAETKLNAAERLKSKSPALYFNRARLMELKNFPARARELYKEAMRYYAPQSAEYRTCLRSAERLSRQLR